MQLPSHSFQNGVQGSCPNLFLFPIGKVNGWGGLHLLQVNPLLLVDGDKPTFVRSIRVGIIFHRHTDSLLIQGHVGPCQGQHLSGIQSGCQHQVKNQMFRTRVVNQIGKHLLLLVERQDDICFFLFGCARLNRPFRSLAKSLCRCKTENPPEQFRNIVDRSLR